MPKVKPNIGLSDKNRSGVVTILSAVLADEFLLYTKTRNFHWNVTGPAFKPLHSFFEELYEQMEDFVDDTAERIRAMGGVAPGSLAEFLALTSLKESKGAKSAEAMLVELLKDHETIIRNLREAVEAADDDYEDEGTTDYLVGLLTSHEKIAWMLRAHLE